MDIFSTKQVSLCERLEFWRELVYRYLLDANADIQVLDKQQVNGTIARHDFGLVKLMEVESPKNLVKRDYKRIAQADDEFALVLLQLEGHSIYTQGKRTVYTKPGDLTLYDSLLPHQLDVANGYKSVILRISRQEIIHYIPYIQDITAIPIPTDKGMGRIAASLITMLAREVDEIDHEIRNNISDAILDTLAATANSRFLNNNHHLSTSSSALLQRIKCYIRCNLHEGFLNSSRIAREHNISKRYVNRLFESEGTSVTRWICKKRLEQCAKELTIAAHLHRGISEIAYSWGFNNLSYFCRKFKALYGCSPREYRFRNLKKATNVTT